MRRFIIEQSDTDITPHSGLALVGAAINQQTQLVQQLDGAIPLRHGIPHSDLIKSYLGLLSMGKNDFEAIQVMVDDDFFKGALDVDVNQTMAFERQTDVLQAFNATVSVARTRLRMLPIDDPAVGLRRKSRSGIRHPGIFCRGRL